MATQIERYIPPSFNKSILYTILIPEIINGWDNDFKSYIKAISKFEIKCENTLIELFRQIGIQASVKRDRYSLPYKNEVIGEIEGSVYINHAFNLDNIARVFVKDLLEKNVTKIRFYLTVDVITEDEAVGKRYNGKVVYKFRYMVHA